MRLARKEAGSYRWLGAGLRPRLERWASFSYLLGEGGLRG